MPVNQSLTLIPANNTYLTNAILNSAYATTITASAPSSFKISSSQGLPPGCVLSTINDYSTSISCSGGPTQTGLFAFTVQATSASQGTSYANYALLVNGNASISPQVIPNAQVNTKYTYGGNTVTLTLTANSGDALSNVSFKISRGSMPPGLVLNSNTPSSNQATITGTPTYIGTYVFTVQATYSIGGQVSTTAQPYSINVQGSALSISPAGSFLVGYINQYFTQTFTASGGAAPYTYSLSNSNLPSTLTLNSATGVLSGTPTTTGDYTFTVKAQDASGQKGSQSYELNIEGALTMSPTSLSPGMKDIFYSQQFTTTGGVAPYTYTISSGNLPLGLTLSSTGLLSGVPTTATSSTGANFTIQVTDSSPVPLTITQPLNLTINTVLITTAAQNGFNICTVNSDNSLGTCTPYYSSTLTQQPYGSSLSKGGYLYSGLYGTGNIAICSIVNNKLSCNSQPTISNPNNYNAWNVAINNNYLYMTYASLNQVVYCQIVASSSGGETINNCKSTGSGFSFPIGLSIYNNRAYIVNEGSTSTYSMCVINNDGSLGSCSSYNFYNSIFSSIITGYLTSVQFANNYAYFTLAIGGSGSNNNTVYRCPLNSNGILAGCFSVAVYTSPSTVQGTTISNSAYYLFANSGSSSSPPATMYYMPLSTNILTQIGTMSGGYYVYGNSTFG